ncbi:hypothetical protein C2S51_002784 [Perilla frutescens var. frutescens]|nr:hypothetical protein C2S51_002784 [Perilla frutescens var. frutescens]
MKSGLQLIPLLLLALVIHGAQGMELIRKGSLPVISDQFMSHEKTSEDAVGEFNMVWKSKFSGRARKLMITSPIPTTTTISKVIHVKGSSTLLEELALRFALHSFERRFWQPILVECDNKNLIDGINGATEFEL